MDKNSFLLPDSSLKGKTQVILAMNNRLYSAILCPSQLSPDKRNIRLGEFASDEIEGWYRLSEVIDAVDCVLKEFEAAS